MTKTEALKKLATCEYDWCQRAASTIEAVDLPTTTVTVHMHKRSVTILWGSTEYGQWYVRAIFTDCTNHDVTVTAASRRQMMLFGKYVADVTYEKIPAYLRTGSTTEKMIKLVRQYWDKAHSGEEKQPKVEAEDPPPETPRNNGGSA